MENKEKNFVSAVIYVHNSQTRIEKFLKLVMEVLENHFEHSEIICVNDSSDDNSVMLIKQVSSMARNTTITILNMSYYHGLELAMNAGMDLAIGDFVYEFDSTIMDFNKEEIMNIYYKSLEGYDIVSAAPKAKQKLSSAMFYKVFNRYTDYGHKMMTERFRILSRRVINRISSMNKTMPYRKAVYANCGLKVCRLSYDVKALTGNEMKLDRQERKYRRDLAVDSLILFTELGYHFSITMTFLMMLVAVAVAVYSVVIYLLSNPVAGWTTTIFFMAVAFFGLFGILTVIIKYLQILVDLVFKRKKYSFESIEKIK